jgi:hypothetical protein
MLNYSSQGNQPKLIAIAVTAITGIVYTVPAGKRFVGQVVSNTTQINYIGINGVNVLVNQSSAATSPPLQLDLPSGTVISIASTTYNWTLLGSEQ